MVEGWTPIRKKARRKAGFFHAETWINGNVDKQETQRRDRHLHVTHAVTFP